MHQNFEYLENFCGNFKLNVSFFCCATAAAAESLLMISATRSIFTICAKSLLCSTRLLEAEFPGGMPDL